MCIYPKLVPEFTKYSRMPLNSVVFLLRSPYCWNFTNVGPYLAPWQISQENSYPSADIETPLCKLDWKKNLYQGLPWKGSFQAFHDFYNKDRNFNTVCSVPVNWWWDFNSGYLKTWGWHELATHYPLPNQKAGFPSIYSYKNLLPWQLSGFTPCLTL